jgi:DNA-binding response OmpR family regulator
MGLPIKKANILIIDSNKDKTKSLVDFLKKENFRANDAGNISDALHKAANEIFDIIFLEINLPNMKGVKGLLDLRRISPHSRIIVMTASPSVETAISTMKNGAVDYLTKPLKNEDLLKVIRANIHIDLKDDILTKLGEKIKSIRKGKGIKIKQLSSRSGLTESSISMIENGKISPSITTINKIAVALGVHPIEFFEIERHKRWIVTRKPERERLQISGNDNILEYLCKERGNIKNEIYISNLSPNQKSYEERINHEGEKFCLVLKGTIDIELGSEIITLNEGDTILFDSMIPHLWKRVKSKESHTLWMISRNL